MQLSALVEGGALAEVPTTVPVNPGYFAGLSFGQQGWNHFMYESALRNTGQWSDAPAWPPAQQAGFDWWFDTSMEGANDPVTMMPLGGNPGTVTESALTGGVEFYKRTVLQADVGWAYHSQYPGTLAGRVPSTFAANGNLDATQTWLGITATLDSGWPVVLMLDSWALVQTGDVNAEGVDLAVLGAAATTNPQLEEDYVLIEGENSRATAIGHTVVAVGWGIFNVYKWIIVQDGDHTSPRYIALAFDTNAGHAGFRSVWQALVASFFVLAV